MGLWRRRDLVPSSPRRWAEPSESADAGRRCLLEVHDVGALDGTGPDRDSASGIALLVSRQTDHRLLRGASRLRLCGAQGSEQSRSLRRRGCVRALEVRYRSGSRLGLRSVRDLDLLFRFLLLHGLLGRALRRRSALDLREPLLFEQPGGVHAWGLLAGIAAHLGMRRSSRGTELR